MEIKLVSLEFMIFEKKIGNNRNNGNGNVVTYNVWNTNLYYFNKPPTSPE